MEQARMAIWQQAQYLEEGAETCAEGHEEDAKRWTHLHHSIGIKNERLYRQRHNNRN